MSIQQASAPQDTSIMRIHGWKLTEVASRVCRWPWSATENYWRLHSSSILDLKWKQRPASDLCDPIECTLCDQQPNHIEPIPLCLHTDGELYMVNHNWSASQMMQTSDNQSTPQFAVCVSLNGLSQRPNGYTVCKIRGRSQCWMWYKGGV